MAAPTGYPSWVYNQTQNLAIIVPNLSAFNALGGSGTWTTTPFPGAAGTSGGDPGFTITDTRLQQILVEQRVTNQMLAFGLNVEDDPVNQIRPDVLANDSSLTS